MPPYPIIMTRSADQIRITISIQVKKIHLRAIFPPVHRVKSPLFFCRIFRSLPPAFCDHHIGATIPVHISYAQAMGILMRTRNSLLPADDMFFPFCISLLRRCFQPDDLFSFRIITNEILPAVAVDIRKSRTFIPLMVMNQKFLPMPSFLSWIFVPDHLVARPSDPNQIYQPILIHIHVRSEE